MKAMHPFTCLSQYQRSAKVVALLLLMSLVCCVMTFFRFVYTGNYTYWFLVWNLFLAWVPLFAAYYLRSTFYGNPPRTPREWLTLLTLGGVWLLFLPNSPYILTDFVHLDDHGTSGTEIHLLFDATLIFSFALTGMLTGLVSLYWVHKVLDRIFHRRVSWVLVTGILGLTGYGVYLGRVLRWNSWDILVHPRTLLWDVLTALTHHTALSLTALFSAFLLFCYLTFFGFLSISRTSAHD